MADKNDELTWHDFRPRSANMIEPGETYALTDSGEEMFTVTEVMEPVRDLVGSRVHLRFWCLARSGKAGQMTFRKHDIVHLWVSRPGAFTP